MSDITFGGFDQVGNEVIPALELHVNLRVGVLVAVAQSDQPVVSADDEHQHKKDRNNQNNNQ